MPFVTRQSTEQEVSKYFSHLRLRDNGQETFTYDEIVRNSEKKGDNSTNSQRNNSTCKIGLNGEQLLSLDKNSIRAQYLGPLGLIVDNDHHKADALLRHITQLQEWNRIYFHPNSHSNSVISNRCAFTSPLIHEVHLLIYLFIVIIILLFKFFFFFFRLPSLRKFVLFFKKKKIIITITITKVLTNSRDGESNSEMTIEESHLNSSGSSHLYHNNGVKINGDDHNTVTTYGCSVWDDDNDMEAAHGDHDSTRGWDLIGIILGDTQLPFLFVLFFFKKLFFCIFDMLFFFLINKILGLYVCHNILYMS
ncbi:hypothetical protein RFI_08302 [Reticulomyxa filosa]|uniref:Uncharacterized protein n=1 Tax=Reticulomyxa filosa TaxID=46433 RepID=X6NS52_RETFI|nr:hypothetical protein RFI_08302 [Reticulomyxa filosa]|eukprot:ETO28826.1 hypothetical protein RFI_08302 [Reticulomyxa filosa]